MQTKSKLLLGLFYTNHRFSDIIVISERRRQTIKEIEVNVAYRWFLGLDMLDPVPHFSTFGKNYPRRFKDTDPFEQKFSRILEECMKYRLVDTSTIFVDATVHIQKMVFSENTSMFMMRCIYLSRK